MPNMGCASEYEVMIVDSVTQVGRVALPWSNIQWDRRRNQISEASVAVAGISGGVECCSYEGGLFPWSQMLRIERNGAKVWDGPITGWSISPGSGDLTISAMDRFAITQKRLVGVYRYFDGTLGATPNSIMRQLVTDGAIGNPTFDFYTLTVVSSSAEVEQMTREYRVERVERIFDCIDEVVNNSTTGFYVCVNDSVYMYEPDIRVGCGNPLAGGSLRLSEDTTLGRPGVNVDGTNMATRNYAAGSGQGTSGFPVIATNSVFQNIYLTGLLEQGSAESRSGTAADLALIAARLAAQSATPAFTIEKVQVNETFGSPLMRSDLSNLIPGVVARLDFDGTCAFRVPFVQYFEIAGTPQYTLTAVEVDYARIDMIEATVSKSAGGSIDEKIELSLRPYIPSTAP